MRLKQIRRHARRRSIARSMAAIGMFGAGVFGTLELHGCASEDISEHTENATSGSGGGGDSSDGTTTSLGGASGEGGGAGEASVAGAAGMARAADYLKAYPNAMVALLAVELCSLTLQRDDISVANMISGGLFGDGAACVVLAGAEHRLATTPGAAQGPEIVATRSVFYANTEEVMGWNRIAADADDRDPLLGQQVHPIAKVLGLPGAAFGEIAGTEVHDQVFLPEMIR